MLERQPTLHAGTPCKWPEPQHWVSAGHSLAQIRPDADIPRKLLALDTDPASVRGVEKAAENARAAQKGFVALDLPAFDCGHVEGCGPDCAAEEEDECEKHQGVSCGEDEEVYELEDAWAEILLSALRFGCISKDGWWSDELTLGNVRLCQSTAHRS